VVEEQIKRLSCNRKAVVGNETKTSKMNMTNHLARSKNDDKEEKRDTTSWEEDLSRAAQMIQSTLKELKAVA
jgi:hypothetical protein